MPANPMKRFIAGMAGYVILLPISLLLLRSEGLDGRDTAVATFIAVLVALIPILPFLLAMSGVIGRVRQEDELSQRIHLEAVLITALLTGALTMSYGLLESAELVPHLSLTYIAPGMILIWGAANWLVSRRYR